jgi:hypothetical protein
VMEAWCELGTLKLNHQGIVWGTKNMIQ